MLTGAVAALIIGVAAVAVIATSAGASRPFAEARLRLANGTAVGRAQFFDEGAHTTVQVDLRVPSGTTAVRSFHGFHVHANDVADNGVGCVADPSQASSTWFVSADGHLKAADEIHGAHQGDMPSLHLNRDGTASARFVIDRIHVSALPGRAVILHAGPDNFANVPLGTAVDQYTANGPEAIDKTQKTGNSGDRIACGVVG